MTPYAKVFKVCLGQISDVDYLLLDEEILEDDLIILLDDAILNFEFPKVDLRAKDDDLKEFDNELGFDEIQILGNLMAYAWTRRQARDVELLRQTMSPLEFQKYSQANHLNALMRLEQLTYNNVERLKKRYSRRENNKSLFHKLGGE